ncbi:uncharacterized protein EV420DRAFT_1480696 [Desarmillaria tabescens]|uniref:Uncharacterized protein n=1 Tax=Armillaria tabescens TaxID=1929756 RepID=A0AA39K9T4_ARMTA|nr:uncharacterized protein EV420DRAFT_1480696 [Desarmillaria tabescens]KAK0457214.1 hypothetical protein EV420DRAFT_1480696 [Desarmillaria tabescens]
MVFRVDTLFALSTLAIANTAPMVNLPAEVDIGHAMMVTDGLRTLDSQIQDACNAVPNHIMSDVDGKWACDIYIIELTGDLKFWDDIISLKHDFQTVNFTSTVCHAFQNLFTHSAPFEKKFMAAIPVSVFWTYD